MKRRLDGNVKELPTGVSAADQHQYFPGVQMQDFQDIKNVQPNLVRIFILASKA